MKKNPSKSEQYIFIFLLLINIFYFPSILFPNNHIIEALKLTALMISSLFFYIEYNFGILMNSIIFLFLMQIGVSMLFRKENRKYILFYFIFIALILGFGVVMLAAKNIFDIALGV